MAPFSCVQIYVLEASRGRLLGTGMESGFGWKLVPADFFFPSGVDVVLYTILLLGLGLGYSGMSSFA